METQLYSLMFRGGPSDGVVMTTTHCPDESRAPLTLFASGSDDAARANEETRRSEYRLKAKRHFVENGHPIVRCEYEFVPLRLAECDPTAAPTRGIPWFKTLVRSLTGASRAVPDERIANDHTLRARREPAKWIGQ